jgi:hypothetical protein
VIAAETTCRQFDIKRKMTTRQGDKELKGHQPLLMFFPITCGKEKKAITMMTFFL